VEPEAPTIAQKALSPTQIDWLAVVLGLLAFLAVGGLIPLWLLVYLRGSGSP
jgi:hypothetical protein